MDQNEAFPTRNILTETIVKWEDDFKEANVQENLTLAWKDLSVYRMKKIQTSIWKSPVYKEVKILHELNGTVSSGNLVALMGSSGSGKTTLLAAISRRDKSYIKGYLMLNGRLAGAELISTMSGFVPQEDLAIDYLTVSEHMEFMARLMMDKRSKKITRLKRIKFLLSELGVFNCRYTKLKDISRGERKRVSLAVQLLNDPPILFCDEPTTGLDSWAAASVVAQLKKLAINGKLVICSIHQPASGVFELFHKVVLLANGRVAFQGTILQAEEFFASLNYKCPVGYNAPEYYVSILGIQIDKEHEGHLRIRRICNEFQRSDIAAKIAEALGDIKDEDDYFNDTLHDKDEHFKKILTPLKVNGFIQFYWLMWRNILGLKRNYALWIAEFLLLMFVGLIISVPYAGRFKQLDQRDIQNVQGLLYLTVTQSIFLFTYAILNTFPKELHVLLRETANGLYSPLPYFMSKIIFWMPRAIIEPTAFSALIFSMAGLRGGFIGWLGFNFICILCSIYANAYGTFLSATFKKLETAALIAVPLDIIGIMFSGIYLNLATASPYISWFRYISGFYYGTECISILQWNLVDTINCTATEHAPCIQSGDEVLVKYGYDEANFWRNCICLITLYVFMNVVAFYMVVRRSRGTPVY